MVAFEPLLVYNVIDAEPMPRTSPQRRGATASFFNAAGRRADEGVDGLGLIVWTVRVFLWLFAAYLFLIAPNIIRRKPSFTTLRAWRYAHRGLHDRDGGVPENSLPAFEKACQAGFGIELDVRLTKDKQLVVFHDDSLRRMCGAELFVRDLTLEELQAYTLEGTQERIPTFDRVLEVVGGRVPLIVELKTEFRFRELPAMAHARLTRYRGVYCVESFDPAAIQWYKKNAPQVVRGQLAFDRANKGQKYHDWKDFAGAYMLGNLLSRPDFIAYGCDTDKNLSQRLVKAVFNPLEVAWTVRSQVQMDALSKRYDLQIFEGFIPETENQADKESSL